MGEFLAALGNLSDIVGLLQAIKDSFESIFGEAGTETSEIASGIQVIINKCDTNFKQILGILNGMNGIITGSMNRMVTGISMEEGRAGSGGTGLLSSEKVASQASMGTISQVGGVSKQAMQQHVKDVQTTQKQLSKIHKDATQDKKKEDSNWLKSFLTSQELATAAGTNMSNGLANSFKGFVAEAKAGTLTVTGAFQQLGAAMGKAILNALGETLIQMGTSEMTQGVAAAMTGNAGAAAQHLAAGSLESAAGGGIMGAASAFLASGGLVTRPTLAMVGEAGPEAVIPLSKMQGVGGTSLSVGTLSLNFPGVTGTADLSGSGFRQSAARQFIQIQQYANRRTGKRNA